MPDNAPSPIPAPACRHGAAAAASADLSPLSLRFELPLAWALLDHPPAPQHREQAEQANAGVLAFLLQGVDLEAGPRPADEELAEALAPLRIKLDMVLDLLARHAYRDIDLPPQGEVELDAVRILWESPLPPRPEDTSPGDLRAGDWLRISLYFHPTFREPITLFGKVANAARIGPGAGCRVEADLVELPEHLLGDLSRLAFLIQRRQRAQRGK